MATSILQFQREQRGWSRQDLRHRSGINDRYIYRIEVGERNGTRATIAALARGLSLSPEQADHLLIDHGYKPLWADDITIRQAVFLLRNYPPRQRKRFRRAIAKLTQRCCAERRGGQR